MLAILFVLSGTLALGFSSFSRQVLQESITAQQAALIGAVIDEYPHAEQHIIRQVKQADETTIAKGEAVLSQYGLSGPDLIFVPDRLETSFQLQTALFVSLAVLIFVVLTGIFFLFVHRQNKEIGDINNYLSRLEAESTFILNNWRQVGGAQPAVVIRAFVVMDFDSVRL